MQRVDGQCGSLILETVQSLTSSSGSSPGALAAATRSILATIVGGTVLLLIR
jgi:hypothetical protein